ncbi:MAG: hypothetical protein NDJ89_05590 [Oligoflexia bacterium]|nr:hypothetical protein [Oligoflexia bacterium]
MNRILPFANYQKHSGSDLKLRERALSSFEKHGDLEDFSLKPDPGSWWNKKQKNGKTLTKAFDPLFSINQKCAVLRSRISRLRRRFWGFTPNLKYLEHHIWLFIAVNNGYSLF